LEFNRFDVSAKELVWDDPAAWLDWLRIGPAGPVEVIDSDITAITAAADKVIRVGGTEPYLVNVELQSNYQSDLAETIWFRQAALFHRHRLPVLTVLVLLRPKANSPRLTGTFEINMPDGWLTNRYNYRVLKLWGEDPEPYLTAGVNLVPLAPLANVAEVALPGLVERMATRINAEPRPRSVKLWTATYLLMGLCYSEELVSRLLEGVHNMQESTTYQAILREGLKKGLEEGRQRGREEGREEGRIAGERQLLIRQGTKRFGKPDATILAAIDAIRDLEQLESLGERIVDQEVHDWEIALGARSQGESFSM
jgi:predicted transposase YdaD